MKDDNKGPFEIFEEKGDGVPSSDLPLTPHEMFRRQMVMFITMYEWLGCPEFKVLYRLGKWKDHDCDNVETAKSLGLEPDTIRKMLERLEEELNRHQACVMKQRKQKPKKKE